MKIAFLRRRVQLFQKRFRGVGQPLSRQHIAFPLEAEDELANFLPVQGEIQHPMRRLRQFMCLVDDNRPVLRKDAPVAQTLTDRVRKKQIVVANLEQIMGGTAVVQKVQIAAACPSASAHGGNLEEFLVVFPDLPGAIHVDFLF